MFEVCVTRDGHELDVAGPPQHDMVRAEEIYHFERQHLRAVVACIPEGNRQADPSKGDRVLAQDHSIEWVWATLELVQGKPQSFKRVKVHEIEATTPIHEGFGEPGCLNQRVDDEGKFL
jgi:hypothetical protein